MVLSNLNEKATGEVSEKSVEGLVAPEDECITLLVKHFHEQGD